MNIVEIIRIVRSLTAARGEWPAFLSWEDVKELDELGAFKQGQGN